NIVYCCIAALLFLTEVLIAVYINDAFIRPYAGDFLVVILIYAFIRTFVNLPALPLATGVFLFACAIEAAQYFNFSERLG
ncbi:DUF2809 domain-containing protein, partial [Klebsiella pneumoniae]|nr:DUF2809 domain-containing protein [Klebsiella pneumoniae]